MAAAEERARSTRSGGTSRIKERDLLFVLRKDRKRLHRVLELLEVFEELLAGRLPLGDGRDPLEPATRAWLRSEVKVATVDGFQGQ